MKYFINTFFLISFITVSHAQAVTVKWARGIGGLQSNDGRAITVDASGNVYTTGYFNSTVDFDPGPGVYNMVTNGGFDIYISKLDSNGTFKWAKQIGSPGNDAGWTITIDNVGNIYYAAEVSAPADLDPGLGIVSSSGYNRFISKLDSNGNFIWAKKFYAQIVKIVVDNTGNLYATGNFTGISDFDPGPAEHLLTQSGYNGTPFSNVNDVFVLKLDNNGDFEWVKQMGGFQNDFGTSLTADISGNIYATGNYSSLNFNHGASQPHFTSLGSTDVFVTKFDSNGNVLWAKSIGGASAEESNEILLDSAGNIFITGQFTSTADFDPDLLNYHLTSAGFFDCFLLKLNGSGNFVWVNKVGGGLYDRSLDMVLDLNGNIYTTGVFEGTVDFDPSAATFNLTNAGGEDIFISKVDNSGNFIWVKQIGSPSTNIAWGMHLDADYNLYFTGNYKDVVDFDPELSIYNLSPIGQGNSYVLKLSQCRNTSYATITDSVCGNYSFNGVIYDSTGVYTQHLLNVRGCDSIITLNLTTGFSNTTTSVITCESYTWQGQTYTSSGNYTVSLQGNNGCDSVRNLNLIIKNRSFSMINASLCEGQSYAGYSSPGIYIDTLVAANGCDSIRTLSLVVNPKKQTRIDTSICEGASLYAGGSIQTVTGVYYDTLLTFLGCDSIITTHLTVHPKPSLNLGRDINICSGESVTFNPGPFTSYIWQDMSTSSVFTANTEGVYWVRVTDINNCSYFDTIEIKKVLPLPSNFLKPADSLCPLEKLQIRALNNYSSYTWSTGSTMPSIMVDGPGKYMLNVRDVNGCLGKDTINISQKNCYLGIRIPTAFTPNGDGKNDLFKPILFGDIKKYHFIIYNRWGQVIFQTTDMQKAWDGTYGGKLQESKVFVWTCSYQLEGQSMKLEKGTVVLIR